ncbi:Protein of unknown function [Desulfocicer vacuolatum DSM 3385]|uniref:DUF2959 domain-containing protein n=1 Tax=Desulfocicer vacuolatum DSM 3385 TaxID=1121400 RepID=A0A1W2EDU0_9BACT|nr:DUF2959 domain-containing protein [Desulfocicer vacuolatum]SMD07562.1 Protein of unknown function [Desulfocicer vacuolatum DSM 3385]
MKNSTSLSWRALFFVFIFSALCVSGCSQAYYGAMEKAGIHKRDILVERVEKARDAQATAQEEFKSALEQFESVVYLENTDLKLAYEETSAAYKDSEEAAKTVSERIDRVEDVAEALFVEWESELEQYNSAELKRLSRQKITETRSRYGKMLTVMHRAEQSMAPVLTTFHDNVLFLKHNLNAQAIGSLKGEFSQLQKQITSLIGEMNRAIASSNDFLAQLQ